MTNPAVGQDKVELLQEPFTDRRVLSVDVTINGVRYFVVNSLRPDQVAHAVDVLGAAAKATPRPT